MNPDSVILKKKTPRSNGNNNNDEDDEIPFKISRRNKKKTSTNACDRCAHVFSTTRGLSVHRHHCKKVMKESDDNESFSEIRPDSVVTPSSRKRCASRSRSTSPVLRLSDDDDDGKERVEEEEEEEAEEEEGGVFNGENRRSVTHMFKIYMKCFNGDDIPMSDSTVTSYLLSLGVFFDYLEGHCTWFLRDDLVDYLSPRFTNLPALSNFVESKDSGGRSLVTLACAHMKLIDAVLHDMSTDERYSGHSNYERRKTYLERLRERQSQLVACTKLEVKRRREDDRAECIVKQYLTSKYRRKMSELVLDYVRLQNYVDANHLSALTSVRNFVIFEILLCSGGRWPRGVRNLTESEWLEARQELVGEDWRTVVSVKDDDDDDDGGEKRRSLQISQEVCAFLLNYVDVIRPRMLKDHHSDPGLPMFLTTAGKRLRSLVSCLEYVQKRVVKKNGSHVRSFILRKAMLSHALS